jgi:hypothetical protein
MSNAAAFVRFIRLVKIGKRHECWEWQGTCPYGRYGHFSVDGKAVKAHRWIYELVRGPIGVGLVVRHKCDNPKCVNPLHLEVGTLSDNTQDAIKRGRWSDRAGEKHPMARITAETVRSIRREASLGVTQATLAQIHGLSRQHVGRIVRCEGWTEVA